MPHDAHSQCASYSEVKVTTEIRQPHKTEVIDSDQPLITLTFRPWLTFPRTLFFLLLQTFQKKQWQSYYKCKPFCTSFPVSAEAQAVTQVLLQEGTIVTMWIIFRNRYIFFFGNTHGFKWSRTEPCPEEFNLIGLAVITFNNIWKVKIKASGKIRLFLLNTEDNP